MSKFTVMYKSTNSMYLNVEADSLEEAKETAENTDGGEFINAGSGDWEYDYTEDENGNVIDTGNNDFLREQLKELQADLLDMSDKELVECRSLLLGCEVYDENGEIIFSQWDGWNGDYPDIKKKAFPVADMEMVKKAQNFLKKTSTYEDWCSFKNNQFHKWIGKAEWLHSDRWSAAYDWVYDGKFADVDIPDDIINCLVEEWEKSMGLKVGI